MFTFIQLIIMNKRKIESKYDLISIRNDNYTKMAIICPSDSKLNHYKKHVKFFTHLLRTYFKNITFKPFYFS